MSAARRAGALVTAALVLAPLSACTSSSRPGAAEVLDSATDVPFSGPDEPSTAAVPSAPSLPSTSSSPPAPATRTTTNTSAGNPPPTAARSTCTSLTIRVIRGSASAGRELAALQFTNDGSTPCLLIGYPTVTLLLNGRPIGTPSEPSSRASSSRTLAPGDTAESMLFDYTSCQAPLSDQIRVGVPGSPKAAVRPGQLRACLLRVDKLGAPA